MTQARDRSEASNNQPNRESEVFEEARRLTGEQRVRYLDGACGNDTALRSRIEALLHVHDDADAFLEGLTGDVGVREDYVEIGDMVGPYKLLQLIGEGGFGRVYMAEQLAPIRRRVALKSIKLGMDTRQVVARFEAERQALAMMDHPSIASVYDAGATNSGRPYFVMELVKGVPITEYCDAEHLSFAERLGLFTQVCHAVQHAHQKGVIHRDLKPSNVMVTLHDGTPVPKIIDFGIAKATRARLTERTLFTAYGQFIGTPEYMAPEQASMSGLDVDTRADIYSLGVLLFELLTGVTPLDPVSLRGAGLAEMQRLIREGDTPKPSTRVATLERPGETAQKRRVEPGRLGAVLRGDLDWIVLRALEKDRTRRYTTAAEFADDVRRYLASEPVRASPPSSAYRLRKFVARNTGAVVAGVLVAVAVIAGLAGTSVALVWALEQRNSARASADAARLAEAAEAEQRSIAERRALELAEQTAQAESQRDRALRSEEQARAAQADERAALDYFLALLDPSDEIGPAAYRASIRDVVEAAAESQVPELAGTPRVRRRVLAALAELMQSSGFFSQSEHLARAALELYPETDLSEREQIERGHAMTTLLYALMLSDEPSSRAEAKQIGAEIHTMGREVLASDPSDDARKWARVSSIPLAEVEQADGRPLQAFLLGYRPITGEGSPLMAPAVLARHAARVNEIAEAWQKGDAVRAEALVVESLDQLALAYGRESGEILAAIVKYVEDVLAGEMFAPLSQALRIMYPGIESARTPVCLYATEYLRQKHGVDLLCRWPPLLHEEAQALAETGREREAVQCLLEAVDEVSRRYGGESLHTYGVVMQAYSTLFSIDSEQVLDAVEALLESEEDLSLERCWQISMYLQPYRVGVRHIERARLQRMTDRLARFCHSVSSEDLAEARGQVLVHLADVLVREGETRVGATDAETAERFCLHVLHRRERERSIGITVTINSISNDDSVGSFIGRYFDTSESEAPLVLGRLYAEQARYAAVHDLMDQYLNSVEARVGISNARFARDEVAEVLRTIPNGNAAVLDCYRYAYERVGGSPAEVLALRLDYVEILVASGGLVAEDPAVTAPWEVEFDPLDKTAAAVVFEEFVTTPLAMRVMSVLDRIDQRERALPIADALVASRLKRIGFRPEIYDDSERRENERWLVHAVGWMSDTLVSLGRHDEAISLWADTLDQARPHLMPDGGTREWMMTELGRVHMGKGDFAAAEELFREVYAYRLTNAPGTWLCANALSLLGEAIASQHRFAEAEHLLLSGFIEMRTDPEALPDRLTAALERVVRFYIEWHITEPDAVEAERIAAWWARLKWRQITVAYDALQDSMFHEAVER